MKVTKTETKISEATGNIQVSYWFDNGFTGYSINNKALTLRGAKGGIVMPNTPNWVKAKEAINTI